MNPPAAVRVETLFYLRRAMITIERMMRKNPAIPHAISRAYVIQAMKLPKNPNNLFN